MARILAIDWDGVEVRYVLAAQTKDQFTILKAGSAPIDDPKALEEIAEPPAAEPPAEGPGAGEENGDGEEGGQPPAFPPQDIDEDEEDENAQPAAPPEGERYRKIGAKLRALLKSQKVGSAKVILNLERGDVDVLNILLPRVSEAELPEMVQNQVLRDSSAYGEGSPLDFLPLAGGKSEGQEIVAVAMTRATMRHVKEACSAAGRKPAKMEIKTAALCEFAGVNPTLTAAPILLVQEGRDEVNLVLLVGGEPVSMRTFPIQADISDADRCERLENEIIRTFAVGPLAEDDPRRVTLFGEPGQYDALEEKLIDRQMTVECVSPFDLVKTAKRFEPPQRPGRFAPLVGSILAESPKSRPKIDLMHPRRKPKPPNYTLFVLFLLLLVGGAFWYGWRWNEKDLARRRDDIARQTKEVEEIGGQINQAAPLYTILSNASGWDQQGVVVLDELRDLTIRVPKFPEMVVTRLAYTNAMRGRPAFIMSANITTPAVYRKFQQAMTGDGSHQVQSSGPVPQEGEGGFAYSFTATIYCQRRQAADYLRMLPRPLQELSASNPEFYADQLKAYQDALKQQQLDQQKKEQELREKQAEMQKRQQEEQLRQQQLQQQVMQAQTSRQQQQMLLQQIEQQQQRITYQRQQLEQQEEYLKQQQEQIIKQQDQFRRQLREYLEGPQVDQQQGSGEGAAAQPAEQPAEQPAAEQPAAEQPAEAPAEAPAAEAPPAEAPAAEAAPAEAPAEAPAAEAPPAETPPAEAAPAEAPAAEAPPAETPPAEAAPAEAPPAEAPPAEAPPAEAPPAEQPAAEPAPSAAFDLNGKENLA
ncbi:MAG: hypothetical protein IJH68_03810 [Thermoguttaceae bacterium]|nr:hypothetical protein [Thermoguttaceae bacterium]